MKIATMHNLSITIRQYKKNLLLFVFMLLFKFANDFGYVELLAWDVSEYILNFNGLKYINGLLWCIILFGGIRHSKYRVSSFMLYLVFLMQIIPITTIYAFGNGNVLYYNTLCAGFGICEFVSQRMEMGFSFLKNSSISFIISLISITVVVFLMVYIVVKNGQFTLTALDIYKVYEMRQAKSFILGKYMHYLFDWTMSAIIPFLIAKKIDDRQYISAAILCVIVCINYLYSGNKTYLFGLPVILICTFWARRKNFYSEIFICGCIGFFALVFLACYSHILRDLFIEIHSLLGRRFLIVPANNKFSYYDFFSRHPKMGLFGIFPRWLIPFRNYYENINYTYLISAIYYGKPEMNSNTGFLAEGYMRFGHWGTFFIMILFALILHLMDRMQKRAGYAFTIGAFVYPVLSLSDAHLISNLFFGRWMVIVFILFFYASYKIVERRRIKIRIKKI